MCITAIAGGMMIAASYSLVCEGMNFRDESTLGILATIQKLGEWQTEQQSTITVFGV